MGQAWSNQVQNKVIVGGPNGGVFVYDPLPGAGKLIASITDAAKDSFGNTTLAGITSYNNTTRIAVNEFNGTITAYSFTAQPGAVFTQISNITFQTDGSFSLQSGILGGPTVGILAGVNDDLRINDNGDLQQYVCEHLALQNAANIPVNSTTPSTVFTFTVGVPGASRFYRIQGKLRIQAAGAGVVQPVTMRLAGTATFSMVNVSVNSWLEQQGATANPGYITALNADPSVTIGNVANNGLVNIQFDGLVQATAGGTLIVQVRETLSAADEGFTVLAHSFADIAPL